jgi:membrane protein YqaA with SNARE-associated domain
LNTVKHILSRYSGFLWAVLKPLGAWGVFAIAGLDGSLIGMPVDAVVAAYVYQKPSWFLVYVIMAAAGSALGSIVIYLIGYKGGEELLRKRIPAERFAKIHGAFEKHPFWGLMFPAMLPPPTPFKLFVLAASASEMQFSHFLLAIFSGRFLRFLLLSILTIKFGPHIVHITSNVFKTHWQWVLGAVALGLLIWLVTRVVKKKALGAEASKDSRRTA